MLFFQHIVIECKKQELNHYASQTYDKFTPVPLASKGWHHKLSRGDFFKINIYPDVSIVWCNLSSIKFVLRSPIKHTGYLIEYFVSLLRDDLV